MVSIQLALNYGEPLSCGHCGARINFAAPMRVAILSSTPSDAPLVCLDCALEGLRVLADWTHRHQATLMCWRQ